MKEKSTLRSQIPYPASTTRVRQKSKIHHKKTRAPVEMPQRNTKSDDKIRTTGNNPGGVTNSAANLQNIDSEAIAKEIETRMQQKRRGTRDSTDRSTDLSPGFRTSPVCNPSGYQKLVKREREERRNLKRKANRIFRYLQTKDKKNTCGER